MDKITSRYIAGTWEIRRYTSDRKKEWDEFVRHSRNGTFLFLRDYMDYHSDRFSDSSRMVYRNGSLKTLLPANLTEDGILHSHQGLTYGGWVLPEAHLDGADLLHIFRDAMEVWREEGINSLDYKPVPWIYAGQPSQEDLYALFRLGAEQGECLLSSALDMRDGLKLNTLRRRTLKKAEKYHCEIREIKEAGEIMNLIGECLAERYGAAPVHTSVEMAYLMERFPENIRAFGAYDAECGSAPQAGVVIYDTGIVAHTQYIATTPAGRERNLLTLLFCRLIESGEYARCRYFDFGTSNEDQGRYLNEGLLRQKFSFGATGVAYTRWHLPISCLF